MNEAQKPLFTNKIFLLIIFGLVAFVLYFYFFVGTTDVIDVIGRINFFYYAVAFLAFLTAVFFSSLTWYSLLKSLSVKTTFRNALLFMWVGLFFDATVPEPGWSGDLSKAYMFGRASDQDSGRIVASVVGQKIIGMLITVGTIFLGLILLGMELHSTKFSHNFHCHRPANLDFRFDHSVLRKHQTQGNKDSVELVDTLRVFHTRGTLGLTDFSAQH